MISRLWLFGLLLGVPLIGFAVAEGIQAHFNSQLRSAARQQFADADPRALSQLSIDRLCEDSASEFRDLCVTNRNLNLISAGALWAGAVGLALVLGIRLAGSAARTNRRLLLYLFKPGLYLTILILVGLVLVHAAVAMAAIYYGESALAGIVHTGIIIAIGLGALLGIAAMVPNIFALVRKAQTPVVGKIVSQEQAPALWQYVKEIAEKLGALHPEHIAVGLDPNFFVTEADVVCLDGKLSGRTLYCSLPLCRILSTKEFSAIIGHELGHYKGLDTQFSQRFFPVYRGTISSIVALQQSGSEGARVIALLPAVAVLRYFLECFSVAESRISRSRELMADQEGVAASDRDSMTSALVKVHAFSGYWNTLETAVAKALQEGKALTNISKTFAVAVATWAKPEALQDIGATHLIHPTDTHPPLSIRLEALGMTIEEISEAALNVQPASVAIQLLPEPEALEEGISVMHQALLAVRLGLDPDSLKNGSADADIIQSVETVIPRETRPYGDSSNVKKREASDGVAASKTTPHHDRPTPFQKPSSQLIVQCWRCKSPIEVTPEIRGKKVRCSSCRTKQQMPI